MTCWKTFNLSRDYGHHRVTLLSLITMLIAFILLYLPLNLIYSSIYLNEDGALMFLFFLIAIFPLHHFLHAVPLWISRKKVKMKFKRLFFFCPVLSIRCCQSIPKKLSMIVYATPFFIVTSVILSASFMYPEYIHYFSIIGAINLGLCVTDFICINQFIKAPKMCVIEEIDDGFDILLHE